MSKPANAPLVTTSARSRIARRFGRSAVGAAVVVAAVVLPATAANAATPCESNCITDVQTATSGDGGTVFAWSTVNTRADVTIYQDGVTGIKAHVVDNTYRTWHYLSTPQNLIPNTTYDYSLLVYDTAGHAQWRLGSFTTKHRQVQVTISSINVTDDGDNVGAGEETIYARAGNVTVPNPLYSDLSVSSGKWLYPNRTITVNDAAASTPIKVEMVDADCSFCTYGLGPNWTTGSDSQHDWVTASTTVDTHTKTNGWQSFVESNSGPAGMVVYGYYIVNWA